MAVLETRLADVGTKVDVAVGEGTAPATVEPLPVYDPSKSRPRG
jgi:glycine cleavage system aminomethyltransferase T